ncbi:MAG: class II aldolase/adducin family protein, partial [Anaerolineae bacterium]|nr:class II aldolase/adducin family protein [Anaerolineae bacterium]
MLLKELRQQIVDIGRGIYDNRLVNYADGNISARDPETNLVAVKPSGVPWHKLTMEDVAVIDVNENAVETRP